MEQLSSSFKIIHAHASKILAVISLIIVIGVIWGIRVSGQITEPQFHAEDGPVFFKEAYLEGASAIFKPQNGYFVLYQRLIAFFAE